ncbi:hypothetical protein F2Q69_00024628 [Brassica cretica]|uniref:RTR1-type domain-containing protein n=1 Tax=Brassica cretica TaxID=69181 RepID=A0A8S9QBD8_BRACR|nr:hypothetical protein F2Q69_00024628 [Brassica cretica]
METEAGEVETTDQCCSVRLWTHERSGSRTERGGSTRFPQTSPVCSNSSGRRFPLHTFRTMSKDHHQAIAINNDAVHKIQLALLQALRYPPFRRYQESRKFCSGECLVSSRAFAKTLQEVRTSEFDMVKLGGILGLFGDEDVEQEEGLGLDKLTIRENRDVERRVWRNSKAKNKQKKQEDPPFDEMGFTSTVIVPDEPNSKAKNEQKKQEDLPFNEMDFTSTVIVPDEPSVSKLTPQTKQPSPPVVKPEDGEGKTPKKSS